jgi:hypothetical protein
MGLLAGRQKRAELCLLVVPLAAAVNNGELSIADQLLLYSQTDITELSWATEGPDITVWHDIGIALKFSRFHDSHGDLTAMVRIYLRSFVGRSDADLYDAKIILTGSRSKTDAVKACKRLCPDWPYWTQTVDRACRIVRTFLEQGAPEIDLAEGDIPEEAPYVLAPLLRSGEHAVLFGKGGSAKSTLALACACLITSGASNIGMTSDGNPGRVLYLDYEDDEGNLKRRVRSLATGMQLPATPHVFYKKATAALPNMADELSRLIVARKFDGLIVDSAALACGADPEKADTAITYFNALRAMNLRWSLTIAHQSKTMNEKDPMPFGSVFWFTSPRMIWQTRKAEEEGGKSIHVGLWNRKNSNGTLEKPRGYEVSWDRGETTVIPELPRSVVEHRPHLSANDRIHAAMEDRSGVALTYKEIAQVAELPLNTVVQTMGRNGAGYRKDNGGWRLANDW